MAPWKKLEGGKAGGGVLGYGQYFVDGLSQVFAQKADGGTIAFDRVRFHDHVVVRVGKPRVWVCFLAVRAHDFTVGKGAAIFQKDSVPLHLSV